MSGRIVIFGGTAEGRQLAETFCGTGVSMDICVATEYGASLLPKGRGLRVHAGRMDEQEMEAFLGECNTAYCVDATHPYALEVTKNIKAACAKRKIAYIRVERRIGSFGDASAQQEEAVREEISGLQEDKVICCDSVEKAAAFLKNTKGNILITTGSKELEQYTVIEQYQERCFARVLPTTAVVQACRKLGFEGKNLIGMQGPFSEELNYAMMKQLDIAYLVTKNSGKEGGFAEKQEAALRAGVHMVVVERVRSTESGTDRVMDFAEAVSFLREVCGVQQKRQVFLIGMGPGAENQLTQEAGECLAACDVIIGSKRMLALCKAYRDKPVYACYQKEAIAAFLAEHTEYTRAAVVYSGDIGFYSGAKGMKEWLADYEVHPVSGISSVVYFLNRLAVSQEDVKLLSCHGQQVNLVLQLKKHPKLCVLLGEKDAVKQICQTLLAFGMETVRITVGQRLSYPEETILCGTPSDFLEQEVDALSVVLMENPEPIEQRVTSGIADDAFCRGSVPMTKQEIRILSLAKLVLKSDSIVYDIGAGTGSVAIEAALCCGEGQVYAVEKNSEGVRLIGENRLRFRAQNLTVIEGEAPDCLKELPAPTHAFIGGSSGRLLDIIGQIREKNAEVRFVVNAVTFETIAQMEEVKKAFPEYQNMEVVQVSVARGRELGSYHALAAENPVYIFCFGGSAEKTKVKK